jgi:undecaprenyl-diphosphatase
VTILQSIVLGIVQGATEFLPISSSAHLVLVPWILGWEIDPQSAFVFDVLVQLGTLLAVIAFFWKDLVALVRAGLLGLWERAPFKRDESRLAWLILLASLPAAVAGIALKDLVAGVFDNPLVVSTLLILNAAMMASAEWIQRSRTQRASTQRRRLRSLSGIGVLDALFIGSMQALALFPGISRSGSTISGGLVRNLERSTAARFSFLMSVPILSAAGAIALSDLLQIPDAIQQIPGLLTGFLTAAVVGYLAIRWLLGYLAEHSMLIFVVYCTAIGLFGIMFNAYLG